MKLRHLLPLVFLALLLAGRTTAQTFTTLVNFGIYNGGDYPYAGLLLSGNKLYGTTYSGGYTYGSLFSVNTNGTGVTTLYPFPLTNAYYLINDAGLNPYAGLILSGNTLYGTASEGGAFGSGTVFSINTNGTGFTTVHTFTARSASSTNNSGNSDGAFPYARLLLSGNILYGTATQGGAFGNGTVFAVNTDGTGFTNLHNFTALSGSHSTNNDGAIPFAGLILSGSTLYGTAGYGGKFGNGTVFSINTNGTGFTNLHSFNGSSDGAGPRGELILSSNLLFGTAQYGGSSNSGTVFAINTNGAGFTTLHTFSTLVYAGRSSTNSDGANPFAGLILSGNTLYGTAINGGDYFPTAGFGTLFSITLPSFAAKTNTYSRTKGLSLKIKVADLLTNDSGIGVTFAGVNLTTTNGVTLATNATTIFYPNAANVNDQFTYSITDSYGGSATGAVLISVVQVTGSNSVVSLQTAVPGVNTNTLTFAGIPNYQYVVQFATNLTTSPWFNLSTNNASASGLWTVIDSKATNAQRYYRVSTP